MKIINARWELRKWKQLVENKIILHDIIVSYVPAKVYLVLW